MRSLIIAGLALVSVAGCSAGSPDGTSTSGVRPTSPTSASPTSAIASSVPTGTSASNSSPLPSTSTTPVRPTAPTTTRASAPKPSTPHPAAVAATLPLHYATGSARQAITVTASGHGSTTAVLQAWQRRAVGAAWARVGPAVHAWLGTGGVGQASEQTTTTPAGSFTLTQAFGHDPNPGTRLPYRQTTPADWWISEPGRLYNTEQHCSSACPFTQGAPNEHLFYEVPYYDYAVVIDYNRNPVVQGAGSAFFLHVTVGEPTQGCVSIDASDLVRLLRWLDPGAQPRILIGVG